MYCTARNNKDEENDNTHDHTYRINVLLQMQRIATRLRGRHTVVL